VFYAIAIFFTLHECTVRGSGSDAALMHRAGETGGGARTQQKTRWGKRTIRVRLHFGCSPPEEENADCRRAMINIS